MHRRSLPVSLYHEELMLIHPFIQVLDRFTTKDVLHGVLHSILFHRLFGTVKPTTFEVLDVTMVCIGFRAFFHSAAHTSSLSLFLL